MAHMDMDPFAKHPPCFTEAAHLILNGLEKALRVRDVFERSVNSRDSLKHYHAKREAGKSETNAFAARSAKAPNHYSVFCTHEVPYWRACSKCGRDKKLAERNINIVLKSVAGTAFYTK